MNPFTSTLFKRAFKGLLHVEMPVALDLTEPDRLLVVAPHPDDETFGCGGTLSLLAQGPCQVRVLIVSDGAKGDPLRLLEEDVVTVRRNETLKALQQI
ncbi:MAG: PIG-L deacetylase family protein, partial [Methylococcaceae bacterium]